jgi:hypothetical protein
MWQAMPLTAFFVITAFLFLAIVGGIIGIVIEGRRLPAGEVRNPATRDALWPILGWAALFVIYLGVEYVGAQNLTAAFRAQLGTLAVLPLFYAVLATARLIWRSGRRIVARLRNEEPVAWRRPPLLGRLTFPLMFLAALISVGAEIAHAGFSLGFFLLASVAVLLALLHRPAGAFSG